MVLEVESSVLGRHTCLGFHEGSCGYNMCERRGRKQQHVEECKTQSSLAYSLDFIKLYESLLEDMLSDLITYNRVPL